MNPDKPKQIIRPYGDRRDDGAVQLAFTLPVPAGERAREAALQYVKKLGFSNVLVATMEPAARDYTFFVVYGRSQMYIDFAAIEVSEVAHKKLSFDELNERIEKDIGRRIRVVGACIGTDAHAVGIDAIMNMKGFAGDYGLERYPMFQAVNLGAQIDPAQLLARARELDADAVLASQVVTQRDIHKENGRQLIELAREQGLYGKTIFLFGGPRMDHPQAVELGFDAGFGPGTKPSDVANYIYSRMMEKRAIP